MEFNLNNNIEVANKYLSNVILANKLSHAYLFFSNNDSLMEEYIVNFVKSINCTNNSGKGLYFCSNCKNCKQIDSNNYIDFYILDTEGQIKKDNILQLKQDVTLKPNFFKKIYWIKNAETLTLQAANSILKALEEPEDNVIIILSTSNMNLVLSTIISRCQVINITNFNDDDSLDNSYENIEKTFKKFVLDYRVNKNIAVINLIEILESKEDIINFVSFFISVCRNGIYNNFNIEVVNLYEELLLFEKDLRSNVSATLLFENFLFYMIINNRELDWINV